MMIGKVVCVSYPNDPFVLLYLWSKRGPKEQKRDWSIQKWDVGIRVCLTYFAREGSYRIDRYVMGLQLEESKDPADLVLVAVEYCLGQFEKAMGEDYGIS